MGKHGEIVVNIWFAFTKRAAASVFFVARVAMHLSVVRMHWALNRERASARGNQAGLAAASLRAHCIFISLSLEAPSKYFSQSPFVPPF